MSDRPSLFRGAVQRIVIGAASVMLVLGGCAGGSSDRTLVVAISPDIPPYVTDDASAGLEVDIAHAALPNVPMRFVPTPYDGLQRAVPDGRADVALGVQPLPAAGVHYSRPFVVFENVAVSKAAAGRRIERIDDLAGLRVLTWEDADRELGPAFAALFAPGAPHRADYAESADQRQQVADFWAADDIVLVIDRTIYERFTAEMDRRPGDAVVHEIFPPTTDFRAAFRDAAMRDRFDAGLAELCATGGYDALLDRHGIRRSLTICDP